MNDTSSYSRLDRFLHHCAFAGIELQKNISEIESLFARKELNAIPLERPIFITSLPRSGTTLLLETICDTGNVTAHTYRHMPFVFCPITWERLSRRFRTESKLRERVHRDGVMVGHDSVEAFEEILWMAFWKDKYFSDHMEVWSSNDRALEFEAFLKDHMKKLILLARTSRSVSPRYCSKNNANVARLQLLRSAFPDCEILIPFRNPVDQANSMLQQHNNFLEIQARDKFALRYMSDLGHFEFGMGLRPIAFPGKKIIGLRPISLEYWLEYWARAFSWILEAADEKVTFFSYDGLCKDTRRSLSGLFKRMGCGALSETAIARFRAPFSFQSNVDSVPLELMQRVKHIYEKLEARADCWQTC